MLKVKYVCYDKSSHFKVGKVKVEGSPLYLTSTSRNNHFEQFGVYLVDMFVFMSTYMLIFNVVLRVYTLL